MQIFNGTYRWDGKKRDGQDPIAWFPGAYHLKIINLSDSDSGVTHLKPHLCIFSETGNGHSISSNPIKFAKQVSKDFTLDLERVIWVEKIDGLKSKCEIVVFTRQGKLGDDLIYHTERRVPTEAEQKLIERKLLPFGG